MAGAVLILAGCTLPFPGPYQGTVTDAQTGKPLPGAVVEAEWWCHDNPLPDGPGSFFVRSSTVTDDHGAFRTPRETRRGGLFGCSFVLKITAQGYIPVGMILVHSGETLPASTKAYPFIHTSAFTEFPQEVQVKLVPDVPVFLKALQSGVPLYRKVAREKLTRRFGVDCGYDAEKWEKAIRAGERGAEGRTGG
ncbi:MAG: carboxypeptidase-like regulatory domain-containing protein [Pseudomonadota bacterium]